MPIDPERLLAADPLTWDASWDHTDVILYHLGIGAGAPPTDPFELSLTVEDRLVVLPSFATVVGFPPIHRFADLDGFDVDLAAVVHAEHEVAVAGPLPGAAVARSTCRPTQVVDRRVGAVVTFEVITEVEGGTPITNRLSAFIKGEGGVGEQTRAQRAPRLPDRDPDAVVVTPTLPQQALLYRLSGDANPLHADPGFAAAAGFSQPILHGMCTFGMAAKAAVGALLGADPSTITGVSGRFSGVVLPGQVLVHRLWDEGDTIAVETRLGAEGGPVVLKHGRVSLRS